MGLLLGQAPRKGKKPCKEPPDRSQSTASSAASKCIHHHPTAGSGWHGLGAAVLSAQSSCWQNQLVPPIGDQAESSAGPGARVAQLEAQGWVLQPLAGHLKSVCMHDNSCVLSYNSAA